MEAEAVVVGLRLSLRYLYLIFISVLLLGKLAAAAASYLKLVES